MNKKINIDNTLNEKIINTITNYTKTQSKKEYVHGVYMVAFKDGSDHTTISLNSVTNLLRDQLVSVDVIKDGLFITYHERSFNNYNNGMFNKESIKACEDLANSIILYDKTGELTELQNSLKENKKIDYEYDNLIKFEPPLELKKVYRVPVKKVKR